MKLHLQFVTLTIEPQPGEAGADVVQGNALRLVEFLRLVRRCGRLHPLSRLEMFCEYDARGWPHWHLLFTSSHYLDAGDKATLCAAWSVGRINIGRGLALRKGREA